MELHIMPVFGAEIASELLDSVSLDSFETYCEYTTDIKWTLTARYRDTDQGDQHMNRTRLVDYTVAHSCIGLRIETGTICPSHRDSDIPVQYLHQLGLPLQEALLMCDALER